MEVKVPLTPELRSPALFCRVLYPRSLLTRAGRPAVHLCDIPRFTSSSCIHQGTHHNERLTPQHYPPLTNDTGLTHLAPCRKLDALYTAGEQIVTGV